jgi:hypothetical protein
MQEGNGEKGRESFQFFPLAMGPAAASLTLQRRRTGSGYLISREETQLN